MHRFDRGTGAHFLEAIDHHQFTCLESVEHDPIGAFGRANPNSPGIDLTVRANDGDRIALRRSGDCLLRQSDGIAGLRLLEAYPNVQARKQVAIWIGHFSAKCDLACRGVYGQV